MFSDIQSYIRKHIYEGIIRGLSSREFQKNKNLSFINGDQIVAGYDPYEIIKKKSGFLSKTSSNAAHFKVIKGFGKKYKGNFDQILYRQ